MTSRETTSKLLSLVLRHEPGAIGLTLDAQGWADVDELVARANAHGHAITRAQVLDVVATSDKRRFALDDGATRIRANQGHSVAVDLQLQPAEPPEWIYHGTATRFLPSIRETGLHAGSRQHVHLSATEETATQVGRRHGKPVVLKVHAGRMRRDGQVFFLSANGVWLTERVAPGYLDLPAD
jgi:putative RNA 2'-phosphotransferase